MWDLQERILCVSLHLSWRGASCRSIARIELPFWKQRPRPPCAYALFAPARPTWSGNFAVFHLQEKRALWKTDRFEKMTGCKLEIPDEENPRDLILVIPGPVREPE